MPWVKWLECPCPAAPGGFLRTPRGRTMIKFSCVSVISTIVAQGTLWIVFYNLRLWSRGPEQHLRQRDGHPALLHAQPALGVGQVGTLAPVEGGRPFLDACPRPEWRCRSGRFRSPLTKPICTTSGHLSTAILVNAANFLAFGILWILKFIVFNRLFKAVTGEELEPILIEL